MIDPKKYRTDKGLIPFLYHMKRRNPDYFNDSKTPKWLNKLLRDMFTTSLKCREKKGKK